MRAADWKRWAWAVVLGLIVAGPALAQPITQPPTPPTPPTPPPPSSGPATSDSSVGYIDNAIPGSMVRFRFDSAYDLRRPNRSEFFYAPGPPIGDGLLLAERSIDYQEVSVYAEALVCEGVSVFVDVPWHFLNPELNDNSAGLSDVNAGFKWAFLADECSVWTLQVKAYFPSGDADRGLGTDHYSIEPGILFYHSLGERWALEGELRHWMPIDGGAFSGNVLRYGLGVQYELYNDCVHWITPVAEVVGWTALDGQQSIMHPSGLVELEEADGDTIVNLKLGVRFGMGCADLYAGYGRALTGDAWYENIVRLEFRLLY